MALLNWGNALSQAGKAMATVGLEGVKATMEQDKVRLAADLAAKEGLLSDERRANSAIALAGKQGEIAATAATERAKVDRDVVTEARTFTASLNDKNNKAGQDYLAGTRALKLADPVSQAAIQASRDESALNVLKLENGKKLSVAQTERADATTPEAIARADQKIRSLTATSETLNQTGALAGAAAKLDEVVLKSSQLARYELVGTLAKAKITDKPAIQARITELDGDIAEQTDILRLSNAFSKSQIPGYPAASDEWVTGPDGTKIRKVK